MGAKMGITSISLHGTVHEGRFMEIFYPFERALDTLFFMGYDTK
jgi:hypothetical protein